jgi:putative RNA 2'-phosphotransferase
MSLVLRHKPEEASLTLTSDGWCTVSNLLTGLASKGYKINREELDEVVEDNDKKRFQFSDDGKSIRAVQGHSIEVDLKYEVVIPPGILYHGTATRFLDSIKKQGLLKGKRQHVHLSALCDTARTVGSRHGNPIVVPVDAAAMHEEGLSFYLAPNGVWLTDTVPAKYLNLHNLIW